MDTNAPETAPDTVVTLVDLQNILVVFDLASSRGAFRGGELTPIGQLYDKIDKFVKAATPPTPTEDSTTESGSTITG